MDFLNSHMSWIPNEVLRLWIGIRSSQVKPVSITHASHDLEPRLVTAFDLSHLIQLATPRSHYCAYIFYKIHK